MARKTKYEAISNGSDNSPASTFTLQGKRYYISPKRWWMAAVVCWVLFLDIFTVAFFGFINDATSVYFRTSPTVTDILSAVNLAARGLFGIFICLVSERMNFRTLAVIASVLMTVSSLFLAFGVLYRRNFGLVIVGQMFGGSASAIVISLSQTVAVNWFPEHERGSAMSSPWVARRLSTVASNLIATRSLGDLVFHGNTSETDYTGDESFLITRFRTVFAGTFGALAFAALLCCVISRIFVAEHPPLENDKSNSENIIETKPASEIGSEWSLRQEFDGLILVLKNKPFILILAMYVFSLTLRPLADILLSSLVLKTYKNLSDRYVGIMYCVGISLGSLGAPFAGQLLDKFNQPKWTLLSFTSASIVSLAIFSTFLHFQAVPVLFVTYVIMLISRDAIIVCLSHRSAEIMDNEPTPLRTKAFTLVGSVPFICVSVTTYVIRVLMENFGSAVAVLFPMPFLLISMTVYVFFWSYVCKK